MHTSEATGAIISRQTFRAGHLHGGFPVHPLRLGRLPEQYHDRYADAAADPMTYVVWTSGTPIAWRTFLGGWFVPEVSHIPRSHRRILDDVMSWETDHAVDLYESVG